MHHDISKLQACFQVPVARYHISPLFALVSGMLHNPIIANAWGPKYVPKKDAITKAIESASAWREAIL
jgi:hypothetical protein